MRALGSVTRTVSDWISWYHSPIQDEWATWEDWQFHQLPIHFEKSDIFQYYLTRRPNFIPPINSCLTTCNNQYYIYCFGDFSSLLVSPHTVTNNLIIDYITILLDVYDVCKGIRRKLKVKGDPVGISLLRTIISTGKSNLLSTYDFSIYSYPYHSIHAHTVAQYSLSTLVMRLLSHYQHQTGPKTQYPHILVSKCKESFDKHLFGVPATTKSGLLPILSSSSIAIPLLPSPRNSSKPDDIKGHSWPREPASFPAFPKDQSKFSRCKICSRVAENLWGTFDACLDCHTKRICTNCGIAATIITQAGFPKCLLHQKL